MARIFMSYSRKDLMEAIALRDWLIERNPSLSNSIFLDVDLDHGLQSADDWWEGLKRAIRRSDAVLCLLSENWSGSSHCRREYDYAVDQKKEIHFPRLGPSAADELVGNIQWVDLHGDAEETALVAEHRGDREEITFSSHGLRQLGRAFAPRGIEPESFAWPPKSDEMRVPYPGVAPFADADAGVYFGREPQLASALSTLDQKRTGSATVLTISAPSGAGKTSFLEAGLLPRIRRDGTNYVVLDVVKPDSGVVTGPVGLGKALHAGLVEQEIDSYSLSDVEGACVADPAKVVEMLGELHRAASLDNAEPVTLLLPIDRGEELVGADLDVEAAALWSILDEHAGVAPSSRPPLLVVVAVRRDRAAALRSAEHLQSVACEELIDFGPVPHAEYKEVIEGPVSRSSGAERNFELDAALVERLLGEFRGGADPLPLLSRTLRRLLDEYGDDGKLEDVEYQAMGGQGDVIARVIDEEILSRDADTRMAELAELRKAFVPRLATIDADNKPIRKAAEWDALPSDSYALLDRFVESRLLTRGSNGDVGEIAVDGLLEHWADLKQWLEQDRDTLREGEQITTAAEAWRRHGRGDDYLLAGNRIAQAERVFDSPLGSHYEKDRDFVEASRRHARYKSRRSRILTVATVVCLVLAGVAGVAWYQTWQRNTGLRLITQAEQMLDGGQAGGDVRALQQLLAADELGVSASNAAEARRDLLKIMENPSPDPNHVISVRSLAATANGSSIATVSADKRLRIWDAATARTKGEADVGSQGAVLAVAYSPDGRLIATGDADGVLQLWDANTALRFGAPMHHDGGVTSLAFSPDSQSVVTGSAKGGLTVWSSTGAVLFSRTIAAKGAVRGVAFKPKPKDVNGRDIIAGAPDVVVAGDDYGNVGLWDSRTAAPLSAYKIPGEPSVISIAYNVALGPNGAVSRVAVGLSDGTIRLLDGLSLQPQGDPIAAHPGVVNSVAFSVAGSRIVSGGTDNTVRVWVAKSDETGGIPAYESIGVPLIGHHGAVSAVTFNDDATRIISGGSDGSVRVWDAVTGLPVPARQGAEVRSVAVDPTPGSSVFASGGTDGTVKLWNRETAAATGRLGTPYPGDYDHSVNSVAYSPQGDRLVSGAADGQLRLWNLAGLPEVGRTAEFNQAKTVSFGPAVKIKSVAFSVDPEGSYVITGDTAGFVRLFDGHTLDELGVYKVPYQVWSVAFGPDGRAVSGSGFSEEGSEQNLIQMWSVNPQAPRYQQLVKEADPIPGPAGWNVYSVSVSKDGKQVAAGSNDGTVRLWDIASRQPLDPPLSGDQNTVMSVAFAHGGQPVLLATGSGDGKVRMWNTAEHEPVGSPLAGHGDTWVHSVMFSADDSWLVSGGADGKLHLWSLQQDVRQSVCSKISGAMSAEEWDKWVSGWIWYEDTCRAGR